MNKIVSRIARVCAALVLVFAAVLSVKPLMADAKPMTSSYLIIAPHTPEQCLKVLDEVKDQGGDKALAKYDWGCMAGDHTGYRMVTAASEADALNSLPPSMRSTAKAVKLNKFTSAQIQSFHEKK